MRRSKQGYKIIILLKNAYPLFVSLPHGLTKITLVRTEPIILT